MNDVIENFYRAYWQPGMNSVYTDKVPKEMIVSPVEKDGWYEWQLVKGTFSADVYRQLEKEFDVKLPDVFIDWHRAYFFADGDCSILRLPTSFPTEPLKEIRDNLDWFIAKQLTAQGLVPFASEGNDAGPLVFDTRNQPGHADYPVRLYYHEYGGDLIGLSEIIFSSFSKLLECVTYYLNETQTRNGFDVIPEFFKIDPQGAGSTGKEYWEEWIEMQRLNFEEFGY